MRPRLRVSCFTQLCVVSAVVAASVILQQAFFKDHLRTAQKYTRQRLKITAVREGTTDSKTRPCPRVGKEIVVISANTSNMAWCHFTGSMLSHLTTDLFTDRAVRADSQKVVVFFETRLNLALWWAIPWTLYMLGSEWSLQLIVMSAHTSFYQELVQAYNLIDVHIDTMEELYGYKSNMSAHFLAHGTFFVTKQFWQGLRGELILIAQDHGVPMRRWYSPEARQFFENSKQYIHMGAPWNRLSVNFFDFKEGPENMTDLVYKALAGFASLDEFLSVRALRLNISTWDGKLWRLLDGGNGGFRLVRRSHFLQLSLDIAKHQRELFSDGNLDAVVPPIVSSTNEDILWGLLLGNLQNGAVPKHISQQFSSELLDSLRPYGTHNYAFHHSIENLMRILDFATQEFFCRNDENVLKLSSNGQGGIHKNWQTLLERFPFATEPVECRTA